MAWETGKIVRFRRQKLWSTLAGYYGRKGADNKVYRVCDGRPCIEMLTLYLSDTIRVPKTPIKLSPTHPRLTWDVARSPSDADVAPPVQPEPQYISPSSWYQARLTLPLHFDVFEGFYTPWTSMLRGWFPVPSRHSRHSYVLRDNSDPPLIEPACPASTFDTNEEILTMFNPLHNATPGRGVGDALVASFARGTEPASFVLFCPALQDGSTEAPGGLTVLHRTAQAPGTFKSPKLCLATGRMIYFTDNRTIGVREYI
ncbi:hypothetical protein D9611_001085 [Ephemerocybe angulata]|uniref:Uncharacterized protein n=1 Tax=Ephemerocybe angulata TaxID=980116 RepID=A0A8H5CIN8_9AGAR|nr:hypothetical protein D9611_001085 [Tulosesus angulatus]